MEAQTKPTIVLTHGIWHSPLTYAKLTNRLQSLGYELHAPFLPSCTGSRPPTASLKEDTQLVRRLLEMLTDQGKTIILVMHSYGGVVGCGAVQDLNVNTRKNQGKDGGVAHLVGLAAHLHPKGFGVLDFVREMGNEDLIPLVFDIGADGSCFSGDAKTLLFGGLPVDEQETFMRTLSRANMQSMEDKVQYEGWRDVPLTYVHVTQDMTLPPHYQQRILEKLAERGVRAEVVTMETGHSPYLTMTEECVKVVEGVAKKVMA